MNGHELVRAALDAVDGGESVVVATVVETDRSVPRHAGSKMLVYGDRRQVGTIGGGEMEARVIDASVDVLASGEPRLMNFDLVDPASGDPGVCGGTITLYLEPLVPEPNVVIVGCGHVGKAVADLAHWLGYAVTALDDRAELATAEQLPTADEVLAGPIAEMLGQASITAQTHIVLVTRNLAVDLEAIPVALTTPARSIGVMGSTRRWGITSQKLIDAGIDAALLDRVRSPIGLDISAETPQQIAVSIMAEITALGQLRRRAVDGTGTFGAEPGWYDAESDSLWLPASGQILEIPLDPARWIEQACAIVDRDLTQEEWNRFVPGDEPLRSVCS